MIFHFESHVKRHYLVGYHIPTVLYELGQCVIVQTARGSIGAHFKAKLSEKTISDYVWVFWQFSGDRGSKIKKKFLKQTITL